MSINAAGKKRNNEPLKICLVSYRGNPTCGGQGVYMRYLSKALLDLGHQVDVVAGPPYPELDKNVTLYKLPGLDLYNPHHLFKVENKWKLTSPINLLEYFIMCLGGFPEPLAFSLRLYRYFRKELPRYDIVHDNQTLAYGLLGISRLGYRVLATIHHPITIDRDFEVMAAKTWWDKLKVKRWYGFIAMQKRVSRRLALIITGSDRCKNDIRETFKIPAQKLRVVPLGINTDFFYPLPDVDRMNNHLLVTISADTPLKGLEYLLQAVASIHNKRDIKLTVIGEPKENGKIVQLVKQLGINECVKFTGKIRNEDFARYYAQATVAVVPSLYEGFGMPAGEAMACGVPVISTSSGALPEVVGDAGIVVPPADKEALEKAILFFLDSPENCRRFGMAGLERVKKSFTWNDTAKSTVDVYRELLDANGRR
jgi:MMP alpha-(1->4)-mannosyltransferase